MTQGNRSKLVVLDQNMKVLYEISRVANPWMEPIVTSDPKEAMAHLEKDKEIKVFLTEQVLSNASGISLLDSIRSMRPDVRRVLMSDAAELRPIIEGLHSGTIGRLLYKPFQPSELLAALGITAKPVRATA
ncbi:MAG TPA: response regulator [Tepidisphaeraceae bacterium]|nr:response regulator [Tepidisphaeraceae bacterium]